jgi:hypothetical protein
MAMSKKCLRASAQARKTGAVKNTYMWGFKQGAEAFLAGIRVSPYTSGDVADGWLDGYWFESGVD